MQEASPEIEKWRDLWATSNKLRRTSRFLPTRRRVKFFIRQVLSLSLSLSLSFFPFLSLSFCLFLPSLSRFSKNDRDHFVWQRGATGRHLVSFYEAELISLTRCAFILERNVWNNKTCERLLKRRNFFFLFNVKDRCILVLMLISSFLKVKKES